MAVIQQSVWTKQIQELLYPDNSILSRTTDLTQYLHYLTVNIPNAGSNGNVVMNRALGGSLGATYQRTDNVQSFNINSFTTDTVIVSDIETEQLSYDKRQSIILNAMYNLETIITDTFLYSICPNSASGATFTSGPYSANTLAYNYTGATATGTRKQLTLNDVVSLAQTLDKQNVPPTGRVMVVPSQIWNFEMLLLPNILNAYQVGQVSIKDSPVSTGYIANVFGFDMYKRPSTVVYTSGNTSATLETTVVTSAGVTANIDTTSSWAVIGYHPMYVGFAKGQIKTYYAEDFPTAYGPIISFSVFAGGSNMRTDGKGVAVLIQSN